MKVHPADPSGLREVAERSWAVVAETEFRIRRVEGYKPPRVRNRPRSSWGGREETALARFPPDRSHSCLEDDSTHLACLRHRPVSARLQCHPLSRAHWY